MDIMRFKISILFILGILILAPTVVSAYDYTGTIYENGDQYWDDNEIVFYDFELDDGEVLEIDFQAPNGYLFLMVCDCSDYKDVEDILTTVINYDVLPDELYLVMDNQNYTSNSYRATDRIDVSIAIFTYNPSNPQAMSYKLTTNLPEGNRINDWGGVLIFLGVIAVIVGIYYWNKNKKKNLPYGGVSGYQSGYQTGYQPASNPDYQYPQANNPSSSVIGGQTRYCPNCGKSNTTKFCTDCGTQI